MSYISFISLAHQLHLHWTTERLILKQALFTISHSLLLTDDGASLRVIYIPAWYSKGLVFESHTKDGLA
jgi:hypothetical protein